MFVLCILYHLEIKGTNYVFLADTHKKINEYLNIAIRNTHAIFILRKIFNF